jgi:hypothetical protein
MYKITTSIVAAFVFALLAASPAQGQDWAQNMFTEFEHDFGIVPMGQNPVHKFKITNKYKETIRILGVTSSCGCTTPTLSKNVLASLEEGELVCQFNSNVGLGFKQATVTVRFAEPFVGEVRFVVKGTIRNDVLVEPAQLDFGTFSPDNSPQIATTLSRFSSPNWRIKDVRSVYPHIGVTLAQRYRGQDKVVYDLTASVKPSAESGRIQGDLVVIATDGRVDSQIRIPLTGKVSSPLMINPEVLTFSNAVQGEESSQRIVLKADKEFRLVDVTCENRNFTVKADGKSKKVHFIEVVYTGQNPGTHEALLTFVTDLDTRTSGTLKAVAEVQGAAVTAGR